MLRYVVGVLLVAAALAGQARADSITLEFQRVSNNASENVADQFSVVISDHGDGSVLFVVSNDGPVASSITDVYWGPKTSLLTLLDSTVTIDASTTTSGVLFANGARPANAPGGSWIAGASADSEKPTSPNGIGIGEAGGFLIARLTGVSWADIKTGAMDGDLRMALKVASIGANGNSDTFESVVPVPEPTTLGLLGLGLATIAARRRRAARA
jgi:hypothetical protein